MNLEEKLQATEKSKLVEMMIAQLKQNQETNQDLKKLANGVFKILQMLGMTQEKKIIKEFNTFKMIGNATSLISSMMLPTNKNKFDFLIELKELLPKYEHLID